MEQVIANHEVRLAVVEEKLNSLHQDFRQLEESTEKIVELLSGIDKRISRFETSFTVVCWLSGLFFSLASLVLAYKAIQ